MHNPLFQNILPEDIPVMLKRLHAYTKSYPKEEYIRHAGDPADFIGIVESGSIHVLQDDYYGNRNITASISEGSLFGEAFVCAGIPHLPVDIVAAEDCNIMFLNGKKLLNTCDNGCRFHHTLIRNLLGIVAQNNMYLNQKIKYISRKTTREKLMAYLTDQAKMKGSNDFTISFNRQELADYLGVERSAMSAELGKLTKLGILQTPAQSFHIIKTFRLIRIKFRYHLLQYSCRLLQF